MFCYDIVRCHGLHRLQLPSSRTLSPYLLNNLEIFKLFDTAACMLPMCDQHHICVRFQTLYYLLHLGRYYSSLLCRSECVTMCTRCVVIQDLFSSHRLWSHFSFISWPTFVSYLSRQCLEWDNVPQPTPTEAWPVYRAVRRPMLALARRSWNK